MASQLFKFGLSKPNQPANPVSPGARMDTSKMEMSDSTFVELRELVYKLCGIYYTESKKYLLEGRIAKRLVANKLNTFEDYLKLIAWQKRT